MTLIVTGTFRSGTTAIHDVLNKHPDVLVTNEYNYWNVEDHFWDNWKKIIKELDSSAFKKYRDVLEDKGFNWRELHKLVSNYKYKDMNSPSAVHEIPNIIKSFANQSGHSIYGDKMPYEYLWQADDIQNTFPSMKWIITLRDGRDVLTSNIRRRKYSNSNKNTNLPTDIKTVQNEWIKWIKAQLYAMSHLDDYLLIRYENAVQHPMQTFDKIGKYLNIDIKQEHYADYKPTNVGAWKEKHPNMMSKLNSEFITLLELFGYVI